MRIAGWLLALGLAGTAIAGEIGLPSGKFEGKGNWKGPEGSTGVYTVSTEIEGRTMTSRFVWSEPGKAGKAETAIVTFGTEGRDSTFDVTDGTGKSVGSGFCFGAECFYRAEFGGIVVQETVRFTDGRLHKLGTKSGPGFRVIWSEELTAQ